MVSPGAWAAFPPSGFPEDLHLYLAPCQAHPPYEVGELFQRTLMVSDAWRASLASWYESSVLSRGNRVQVMTKLEASVN